MNVKAYFLALFVLISCDSVTWADDVYNFYFQKAPGGKKVIQSANGQEVVTIEEKPVEEDKNSKENFKKMDEEFEQMERDMKEYNEGLDDMARDLDESATASVKTSIDEQTEDEPTKWTVGAGIGVSTKNSESWGAGGFFETYSLSGAYRLSEYWDVTGTIHFPRGNSEDSFYYGKTQGATEFNAFLGVDPIQLDLFGRRIFSMGFLGGLISGTTGVQSDSPFVVRLGYGLRGQIHFSRSWAISMQYLRADTNSLNHTTLALNYSW